MGQSIDYHKHGWLEDPSRRFINLHNVIKAYYAADVLWYQPTENWKTVQVKTVADDASDNSARSAKDRPATLPIELNAVSFSPLHRSAGTDTQSLSRGAEEAAAALLSTAAASLLRLADGKLKRSVFVFEA